MSNTYVQERAAKLAKIKPQSDREKRLNDIHKEIAKTGKKKEK
tara:strand:- start:261 stop:389 length:129 start_codon:yes stop_codon:yes gene_type:complete